MRLDRRAVAQVVDRHVHKRKDRADRHAEDRAGGGDIIGIAGAQQPQRERQTDEELARRLNDLGNGGGGHVEAALRVAAERGQTPDADDSGRERADAVRGAGVVEKSGKVVVAPPHEEKGKDAERQKHRERHVKYAPGLGVPAERVRLGDHLRQRDGKSRSRNGEKRGVNVVGVVEIRCAGFTENVEQRDLEHRADDLDDDDPGSQNGCAAEEGLLLFRCHTQNDLFQNYMASRQPRISAENRGAEASAIALTSSPESG